MKYGDDLSCLFLSLSLSHASSIMVNIQTFLPSSDKFHPFSVFTVLTVDSFDIVLVSGSITQQSV